MSISKHSNLVVPVNPLCFELLINETINLSVLPDLPFIKIFVSFEIVPPTSVVTNV